MKKGVKPRSRFMHSIETVERAIGLPLLSHDAANSQSPRGIRFI